jgi:NAD(P)H dehydrogenase (quinone)
MGQLWAKNTFVGRIGSVMTSSNTQHGGQETTIIATHFRLLHLGMILVGCPYSEKRLFQMNEISGGGPYGASCVVGQDASKPCSENELAIARFQGKHVAGIARKLFG